VHDFHEIWIKREDTPTSNRNFLQQQKIYIYNFGFTVDLEGMCEIRGIVSIRGKIIMSVITATGKSFEREKLVPLRS
jgi:hypothetical protein